VFPICYPRKKNWTKPPKTRGFDWFLTIIEVRPLMRFSKPLQTTVYQNAVLRGSEKAHIWSDLRGFINPIQPQFFMTHYSAVLKRRINGLTSAVSQTASNRGILNRNYLQASRWSNRSAPPNIPGG
jgi:hypothetical protein